MAVIVNATFETGLDHHADWFGETVSQSTADFHTGAACLLVSVSATFSGVQLDNFPYYAITAGSSYDFSVWYKEATATMPDVSWNINWYDSAPAIVRTDTITLTRSTSWSNATGTYVAPAGSVRVGWAFQTSSGAGGTAYYLDDLVVQDTVVAVAPRPPIMAPGLAAIQSVW